MAIVQGFVTGQNYYATRNEYRKIGAAAQDVALWLDVYCHKNGTHTILLAAAAFVEARGGPKAVHTWMR